MNVRQLSNRIEAGQQTDLRRPQPKTPAGTPRGTFAEHLERARQQPGSATISHHAWQRIRQRGISMTDAEQHHLAEAMHHLAGKGARDALLLRPDAAFVVNVPNRTVVTAIDHSEMQQRVFTQIDSAMMLGTASPSSPST